MFSGKNTLSLKTKITFYVIASKKYAQNKDTRFYFGPAH